MVPFGRQDLHRLETVPKHDVLCTCEDWHKVAVEREAGHLCTVPVVIMRAPCRLAGVAVVGVEEGLQQRVAARNTGVEHANSWRIC